MSKQSSILVSLAVYLVTTAIAIRFAGLFSDHSILFQIAAADLLATILIFISSVIFNNSSMYDPYWSVKPIVIAACYFYLLPMQTVAPVQALILLLVGLYALRLTANFYRGWPGMDHEDWRYRNFRKQFPKGYWLVSFFGIHFFPTVMVYLGCLPLFAIYSGDPLQLPWLAWIGAAVLLGSVILAFVADEQLRKFRMDPVNQGKSIRIGLWSVSRHPNYLGEILSWWGLLLTGLAYGWDYWWTGTGAVVITSMFAFISIPMIEKYTMDRRPDYAAYMKEVPMLIPGKKS